MTITPPIECGSLKALTKRVVELETTVAQYSLDIERLTKKLEDIPSDERLKELSAKIDVHESRLGDHEGKIEALKGDEPPPPPPPGKGGFHMIGLIDRQRIQAISESDMPEFKRELAAHVTIQLGDNAKWSSNDWVPRMEAFSRKWNLGLVFFFDISNCRYACFNQRARISLVRYVCFCWLLDVLPLFSNSVSACLA
jgi:hypothetical protein